MTPDALDAEILRVLGDTPMTIVELAQAIGEHARYIQRRLNVMQGQDQVRADVEHGRVVYRFGPSGKKPQAHAAPRPSTAPRRQPAAPAISTPSPQSTSPTLAATPHAAKTSRATGYGSIVTNLRTVLREADRPLFLAEIAEQMPGVKKKNLSAHLGYLSKRGEVRSHWGKGRFRRYSINREWKGAVKSMVSQEDAIPKPPSIFQPNLRTFLEKEEEWLQQLAHAFTRRAQELRAIIDKFPEEKA